MNKYTPDCTAVDTVLAGGEHPPIALADLLDAHGGWDWSDDGVYDPSERVAIVASSGAWWAVYRGAASDDAVRCTSKADALDIAQEWCESVGIEGPQ